MYFTGSFSSTMESILSPNTTDELSNEFLENVGIILEKYLYDCSLVITLLLRDALKTMLNIFLVHLYVCV